MYNLKKNLVCSEHKMLRVIILVERSFIFQVVNFITQISNTCIMTHGVTSCSEHTEKSLL